MSRCGRFDQRGFSALLQSTPVELGWTHQPSDLHLGHPVGRLQEIWQSPSCLCGQLTPCTFHHYKGRCSTTHSRMVLDRHRQRLHHRCGPRAKKLAGLHSHHWALWRVVPCTAGWYTARYSPGPETIAEVSIACEGHYRPQGDQRHMQQTSISLCA